MATSPSQRSLALLKKQGYNLVAITEHWNPFAKIRQDLFGFIDIVAIGKGETVGVQTTTYPNISARVKKIKASEHLEELLKSGWLIRVHGWKKGDNGKWIVREVEVNNNGISDSCEDKER